MHHTLATLALLVLASQVLGAQQPRVTSSNPRTALVVSVAHFRDAEAGFTQYSGIGDSLRLVIRDAAEWRSYWTAIHRPFIPAPPVPAVDFSREMIVLVAMGTRPTGGFAIRIENATVESTRMLLSVRRTIPGNGCAVPAVVTQPVDLARIPMTALPISFAERVERVDCSAVQALHRR